MKKTYVVNMSGGKDSCATTILTKIKNEPVDFAIYSEIMFDKEKGISAEHPEHIRFIRETLEPKLNEMGIPLITVRAEKDFKDMFLQIIKNSKTPERNGMHRGFPMTMACHIKQELKIKPILDFYANHKELGEVFQYVGIAADEKERLAPIKNDIHKISLLAKYGYSEADALALAMEWGLRSPIYDKFKRNGCWFCPNSALCEFRSVYNDHPDLWKELEELAETENVFARNITVGTSVRDLSHRFYWENAQMDLFSDGFLKF